MQCFPDTQKANNLIGSTKNTSKCDAILQKNKIRVQITYDFNACSYQSGDLRFVLMP